MVPGSLMWVMGSVSGAQSSTVDGDVTGAGCASSPATAGVSMSDHLRNTAVQRASHCQSDRAWRKAESLLTRERGEGGRMQRVRIGHELMSSLQCAHISLWRDKHCRSLLGLPPLDFLFGSATGVEQLHLHESVGCGDVHVKASAWGGPGCAGATRPEVWRETAALVVAESYDDDVAHSRATLLPDISSHNLRLILGHRLGVRVPGVDVLPPVVANVGWLHVGWLHVGWLLVGWLLAHIDKLDPMTGRCADELQSEVALGASEIR